MIGVGGGEMVGPGEHRYRSLVGEGDANVMGGKDLDSCGSAPAEREGARKVPDPGGNASGGVPS